GFRFRVRVKVVDSLGNHGQDRRAFALHRDPDLVGRQPTHLGSDGVASPVLADLDGDGVDELILATSDGRVHAFHGTGLQELPGWPVHTDPLEAHDAAAFGSGELPTHPYGAVVGTPAVGDLLRTGELQVVAADLQGKVYVWDRHGTLLPGFPVSTIADYSN